MWPNKQNYWLYFGHISVEVRGRKQKKQRCLLTSEGPLLATTTSWLCPFHLPKPLSSPNPPFYSTEMPSMASPFSFLSPLLLLRRFRLTSGGNRWSRFWILVESRLAEMVTYPHPRIAFKKDLQLEFRVPNLRFCRHLHSSRVVCLQFHNLISFLLCVFFSCQVRIQASNLRFCGQSYAQLVYSICNCCYQTSFSLLRLTQLETSFL